MTGSQRMRTYASRSSCVTLRSSTGPLLGPVVAGGGLYERRPGLRPEHELRASGALGVADGDTGGEVITGHFQAVVAGAAAVAGPVPGRRVQVGLRSVPHGGNP